MSVKSHYDNHLSRVYAWMSGDFTERTHEQTVFFSKRGVIPAGNRIAYDLGSGHGIQAIALAQLGFRVTAVDFNRQLLGELKRNVHSLPVESVEGDLLQYLGQANEQAELITCMGDTLSHLQRFEEVEFLINEISKRLSDDGKVILSFRDLSVELQGIERFIHVKSDDTRSMTCFLEYFPEHVMVHDIIVEKEDDTWKQKVSCYPKLRLPLVKVLGLLKSNQIRILLQEEVRGMHFIIGQRA